MILIATAVLTAVVLLPITHVAAQQKPNILFIMGDDIGWMQPSIYHRGLMVGETPNIDRIGMTSRWASAAAHTRPGSADRMMDRDELRAVGERSLDLDLVDHLGDAFHDVVTPQNRLARLHQLRDRTAVADTLEDVGGDERDSLGMVELEAPGAPAARHLGRGEDQELLLLSGCEMHRWPRS